MIGLPRDCWIKHEPSDDAVSLVLIYLIVTFLVFSSASSFVLHSSTQRHIGLRRRSTTRNTERTSFGQFRQMVPATENLTPPPPPLQGAATWCIQWHDFRVIVCLFSKFDDNSWNRFSVMLLTFMGTLKPHNIRPLYSNTVTGTLAVDGWDVTFGTARRGLGGLQPRPVFSSLYQM